MSGIKTIFTPGKVERKEVVTVAYRMAEAPSLDVEVERPYAVKATGQVEGTATFRLAETGGRKASNLLRVSVISVIDRAKAAYRAFMTGASLEGGITPEDVTGVQQAVGMYNTIVDQIKAIDGEVRSMETISAVAPDQLSDLEKQLK